MKIVLILFVAILLTACSTTQQTRVLNIDASLMQPCPPLTLINGEISLGDYILQGIEDYGLYNECRVSKQGLINAINEYKKGG
ncbi:hypothetical protein M316_0104 [Nitrincola phage 1M3-16]|uniref:hypothetical protein n=1 Tax=Nitrincola phage 1M3-16 TaxID=1472912 RepID=UPI000444BDD4|nr:hypothetical protein GJ22_gp048 [Nitrincola phage 1M3-16]AHX01169.1 hypothetical protein M316_0104 [Nitrincola phage 1M3-16]